MVAALSAFPRGNVISWLMTRFVSFFRRFCYLRPQDKPLPSADFTSEPSVNVCINFLSDVSNKNKTTIFLRNLHNTFFFRLYKVDNL